MEDLFSTWLNAKLNIADGGGMTERKECMEMHVCFFCRQMNRRFCLHFCGDLLNSGFLCRSLPQSASGVFPLLTASPAPCLLISYTCNSPANVHLSQLQVCHWCFSAPQSSPCATPTKLPHWQLICKSAQVHKLWSLTGSVPDSPLHDVRLSSSVFLPACLPARPTPSPTQPVPGLPF